MNACSLLHNLMEKIRSVDFLAPLALRLYLVPIFWTAGTKKWASKDNTVAWFGNPDWGLGLPYPELMYYMTTITEIAGAVLLLFGFAIRLISIPLMMIMLVAMASVHWQFGWSAIATGSGLFATERSMGATERLEQANSILEKHGNFQWLTESGQYAVLNNGIEFAATYFIMLMTLLFIGAGKYTSVDYWIGTKCSAHNP